MPRDIATDRRYSHGTPAAFGYCEPWPSCARFGVEPSTVHDPAVRDAVEVVVALFAALILIAFAVRWVRLPLSVALVSFGLLVAGLATVRLTISPDVVLLALLPGLVFEAAVRLPLEDLQRVVGRTIVLAIPGVLLVASVVAIVLHVETAGASATVQTPSSPRASG